MLSQPAGSPDTQLIRSLALEVQSLPGRGWRIEAEDEGFCVVESAAIGPDSAVLVGKLLSRQVYTLPDGELVVIQRHKDGTVKPDQWSLTGKMSECGMMEVYVPAGLLRRAVTMSVAFLSWYRSGCRFLWSMTDIYRVLLLTSFKGVPSKWAYNSAGAWLFFLSGLASAHDHYWPPACRKPAPRPRFGR